MKAPRRSATTTSRRKLRRRFLRAWPLWLVCLACAATGAHAQAPAPYPVLKLTLTNVGPQNVSQSLVKANIRVHEGDNYNRPSIDDDIRNLYSTGFFLNVRVTEERSVDGVNLTYILQTRPKLADIIFTGNKKYSTTRLQKKLTAKIGEPLDERKLFADVQTIRALYQKSGYPKTEVRYLPPAIDEDAGRAVVTIEVVEAPKVKITDVYFEGAYTYPQKKLRKTIKTRRRWMFSWITGTGYIKDDVLEDDKDRLAEFYQDAGYIDFELKEVQQNFNGPRKAELHFVVSEGKRYRVGQINFKGVTLFPTNDLLNRLKMESGFLFTP